MRLLHPDGQNIYVAQVFPAQPENDFRALTAQINSYSGDVTCLSLALGSQLASTLAGSVGMRRRLQAALTARGLEVVTLHCAVQHDTWRTWWTYLLDLARILADLLHEDTTHGSISTTVPVIGEDAWDAAMRELDDLSTGLTEIAWHTGAFIRVGCEIGEGTLFTSVDEAVNLLGDVDPSRIGLTLDPARLAGAAPLALAKLRRANLSVIKVQLTTDASPAALLAAMLGGPHPLCDHYEVNSARTLKSAQEEFSILCLGGTDPATGSAASYPRP
jgi:hypothetical protein